MKIKLSKAQTKVIESLRKNEIIHYVDGLNAHCFDAIKNISWATIYKLEKLNLIIRKDGFIELTEIGRLIVIN